jgi:hypothetical protein
MGKIIAINSRKPGHDPGTDCITMFDLVKAFGELLERARRSPKDQPRRTAGGNEDLEKPYAG